MQVVVYPDTRGLEAELLSRIAGVHPARGAARTLIVLPTARLVEHVQRRLSERRPAWLGLDVLHFNGLARAVLERGSASRVASVSARLLRALLARVLEDLPSNLLSRFVARRPGALRRLLSAVKDLREAGIEPAELTACCRSELERDLAAVYTRYVAELGEREHRGWVDEAGLVARALPGVAAFAEGYATAVVYGAYELIGIHLSLVRALDRSTRVTALVAAGEIPAAAYAERFVRRYLLCAGEEPEPPEGAPPPPDRLAALYDEESRPIPVEPSPFAFRHAQGASAEVRFAVRAALAALGEGCPPTEIAIAARSLAPYAAALEEALDDEDIPWTSSLAGPLRRHPLVRDFLLALRVVDEDFPRAATVELLRSPRLHWPAVAPGEPRPKGHRADEWSRRARILGGLDEWTEDLPRWAARPRVRGEPSEDERREAEERAASRTASAEVLARTLRALRDRLRPEVPRGWTEHAEHLEAFLATGLSGDPDEDATAARDALRGLLDEMRGLSEFVGEAQAVPFARMRVWLEEAVDGAEIALRREDRGGLRVLDLMQLRGLTFRRIFFLGMNAGFFPRAPREDPLLPDDLRQRLIHRTGRPLPLKTEGADEERLLLALLLGSSRERIEFSWQRADEAGKVKTPSPALRELARVARGRPDPRTVLRSALRIPAHPTFALDALARETGLLSRSDEMLLIALRGDGPGSEILERRFPELRPGLRMLRATEAFRTSGSEYDARVGGVIEPAPRFSVTELETLGACPLRYFFRHVLRVHELDEEASPLEITPREMGIEIHRLLEFVYDGLRQEELFERGDVEARVARAVELLEEGWATWMEELGGRLERRLPLLWRQHRKDWMEVLREFVDEDLRRLDQNGWRPLELEGAREREIRFGGSAVARIVGRLDRRLEGPAGEIVGDYKTSGNIKRRTSVTNMLKARSLQVPLYWLLTGERAACVELLGVGPGFDFSDEDAERARRRAIFEGFQKDDWRSGFLETMRVLLDQRAQGRFPLHPDEVVCGYCGYDQACRRLHPPTLEREAHAADARAYFRLRKKSRGQPLSPAESASEGGGEAP